MGVSVQAQNKFTDFLANFKEVKIPAKVSSSDITKKFIDKSLAWEFALQKSPYTKQENAFVVPFVYYKVSDKVAVLVNASTLADKQDATYGVSIQTFQIKNGKLIDEFRSMAGTFSDSLNMVCEAQIDDKGNITLTTKGLLTKTSNTFNINNKGKIKEM